MTKEKIYDSEASESFIISQDLQKEPFMHVKHRFTFEQSRDAHRERRAKNQHFSVIQGTRSPWSLPPPSQKNKTTG